MYRILYADDDLALLEIGKLFLEQDGMFTVDTFPSATEALERLRSAEYDAIISDYQMPETDGITFLKTLRHRGNITPFIIFTGKGREEVVIEALNSGADFYIQKGGEPVSQYTELAHKVRQAVQRRRAEKSIHDHERREADILNFLPDATFAIDTDGVVIAWNRAMEKMTGVPASAILGKGNNEYAIPFYHERRPILIDLVFEQEEKIRSQYSYVRIEDKILTAETVSASPCGKDAVLWGAAVPLHDTHGTVIGAIESIRDITEMRRSGDALYREKIFSDTVIDSIPGAFFVVNREGQYVRCNKYMEEALGMPAEQICSKSSLFPVIGEDRPAVERAMVDAFLNGYGETRARVMGKRKIVRDYFITGRKMTAGDREYMIGTGIDMTEKFQLTGAMTDSEQRYRTLFNSTGTAIFLLEEDTTVSLVNTEFETMSGYSREEVEGKISWIKLVVPEDALWMMEYHVRRRQEGVTDVPKNYEFRFITKSGTILTMFLSIVLIPSTKQTIVSLVDITERKQLEESLRRAAGFPVRPRDTIGEKSAISTGIDRMNTRR
jgi:PAS domain S-box-containing protein